MCILCIEFQKGKLSLTDAYKNWEEMDSDDKHSQEVLDMLNEALYNEVVNSNGSDYKNEKEPQDTEDIDPAFWYDDMLEWSDYAT